MSMSTAPRTEAGREFFTGVRPVRYEGTDTDNPLAYRYYDKDRVVLGKSMQEHLRLAVCYWHTFVWNGFDVFGEGVFRRPWHEAPNDRRAADFKMDVAFEFFAKLGIPYFCFHDADVSAASDTPAALRDNFAYAQDGLERRMAETGIKLLWGTANLFSHRRYMGGAATNPNPEAFAVAAAQVRRCLEATQRLGGANYVLWGGREGYDTLLNTDMGRELDNLGRFLSLVVEHKHKIGFKGHILVEPKPHEPTKHQYDHDVATVYGFLKRYDLENEVKVNIEANHATLAGHSFEHEVATAIALGIFGSIDINRGDPQNGWDTDQFANDNAELTLVLYRILQAGGFTSGGLNFDAKLRRQSIDPVDLFHAHIGGVDALARALLAAAAMIEDGKLADFVKQRYEGWDGPLGRFIHSTDASLAMIADRADSQGLDPAPVSGRQELLERLVSRFT
jgi:xylose isomerase